MGHGKFDSSDFLPHYDMMREDICILEACASLKEPLCLT